jgi:hypothetical protein
MKAGEGVAKASLAFVLRFHFALRKGKEVEQFCLGINSVIYRGEWLTCAGHGAIH